MNALSTLTLKPTPVIILQATAHGAMKTDITGSQAVWDVLNVSGHRMGTAEIENVLDLHEHVAESAVVVTRILLKARAFMLL